MKRTARLIVMSDIGVGVALHMTIEQTRELSRHLLDLVEELEIAGGLAGDKQELFATAIARVGKEISNLHAVHVERHPAAKVAR